MQLIYRGQTFNFQAVPTVALQAPGSLSQTLFYSGHTYCFKPVAQTTRLPRVINWRYRSPCDATPGRLNPAH
jgi:hypothetical protein